ncbi:response regulator transcription factor [Streptomyces sp. NPDC048219]|uniref:response regulator transcription factor n=1 Tax=Streptomyces sp. NPDC048219 TaxID=3365517 RepID=UPI003713C712
MEDDVDVAEALTEGLEDHGWSVQHLALGLEALGSADAVDIVLLDLNLPDVDGLELCRRLHERTHVPIIAVTGRSDSFDQALCLRLGADDYIVKPYRLHELLARMAAVLRRTTQWFSPAGTAGSDPDHEAETTPPSEVLRHGPLRVDLRQRVATVGGTAVVLTRKEFELLVLLASSPGRVFTRQYIGETVWADQWVDSSRTLDSHIAAVRKKIGHRDWIETVRGVGFRFVGSPA